jgi:hypothetical protein
MSPICSVKPSARTVAGTAVDVQIAVDAALKAIGNAPDKTATANSLQKYMGSSFESPPVRDRLSLD